MKRTLLITLVLFITCYALVFATYMPKSNIETPQAASYERYGDVNVDLFTGNPNISIPIYTVEEGDLKLPISVDYNLASVKPNQRTGILGMGWSLSSGGCISRKVRGVCDEKQYHNGKSVGFYSNFQKLKDVNDLTTLKEKMLNFTGENNSEVFELMTDEYVFNFGQYSGKFYLDENGKWIVVSDFDIKLEFDTNDGFRLFDNLRKPLATSNYQNAYQDYRFFDKFTLVTPDGVRYSFGGQNATEYSIPFYTRNTSDLVATSWFLVKVESPDGHVITLDYDPGDPTCELGYSAMSSLTYLYVDGGGGIISNIDNTKGYRRLSGYLIFPVYLNKITTSQAEVNFITKDEFFEERPNPYYLYYSKEQMYATGAFAPSSRFDAITNLIYKPEEQFSIFMGSEKPDVIRSRFRWRYLHAISIKPFYSKSLMDQPNTNGGNKTFYFDYEFQNRRKLNLIAEREGIYDESGLSYQFGGYNTGNSEELFQYPVYNIPNDISDESKEYRFIYNTNNKLPSYISSSIDRWGYYNGKTINEEDIFNPTSYEELRKPSDDLEVTMAETLSEIIYPTGGKSVLSYEQNSYGHRIPSFSSSSFMQKVTFRPPLPDFPYERYEPEELVLEFGYSGGLRISKIATKDQNDNVLGVKKYHYKTDLLQIGMNENEKNVSGILNGKKEFGQAYFFDGGYKTLTSEGGFLVDGINSDNRIVSYSSVIEENCDQYETPINFIQYNSLLSAK